MLQGSCSRRRWRVDLRSALVALLASVSGADVYATTFTRTITDPAGYQQIWTYDQIAGMSKVVEKLDLVDGKSQDKQYDVNGNLVFERDAEGRATAYSYNATNQRTSRTEALGTPSERTTTYEYKSPQLDLVTRILKPSIQTGLYSEVVNTYDEDLNRIRRTERGVDTSGNTVERTTHYEYNEHGQVVAIDGPRTDVEDLVELTYYECDNGGACGQLYQVRNPLGHVTTYDSYDAAGNLLQMTEPNGTVTRYTYDARMRVSSEWRIPQNDEQFARTTRYTYDAVGQLIEITWPDGTAVRYEYDDSRYLRAFVDALGNRQVFDYDLKGNLVRREVEDPDQVAVSRIEMAYDHRDYVTELNAAGSITRMVNDAVGRITMLYDANDNPPATFAHDALDRMASTVDPLGGITTYGYDSGDRASSVIAPNGSTTLFTYDDLGNILEEVSADRGRTTYRYDAAGNRIEKTDARGEVVTYQYDALNRLTAIDHPGTAADQVFQWDTCENGIGRLCVIEDESGVTEYAHDSFGNVVSEVRTDDAGQHETSYQWDIRDRLVSLAYPNGRRVSWSRDELGRIVSMQSEYLGETETLIDSRTYRADGALVSQSFGNGVDETREYDLRGQLTTQEIAPGDIRLYAYDPNGNVTVIDQGGNEKRYGYDALDRLTGESDVTFDAGQSMSGNDITLWEYDANGNRTLQMKGAGSTDVDDCAVPSVECLIDSIRQRQYGYVQNTNRMVSNGKKAVVLDAAGNTISDRSGKRKFHYNAANRLHEYVEDGVRKATYTYNARNQRARKVVYESDGVTVKRDFRYFYDVNGRLISEYRDGKPLRDYLWADDMLVRQDKLRTNSDGIPTIRQRLTVISDHLNTPRLAYNISGSLVWQSNSNGFGKGGIDRDSDGDGKKRRVRLRFPGQFRDAESGLYYNHHRYYDPQTGRYITSDPIGLAGGINTYGYAAQNPLSWVDPLGLEITGTWIKKPFPEVYNARIAMGDARKPKDWWKFWEHGLTYRSMEHRVDVHAGYNWRIQCADDEECQSDSWELSGGWADWIGVYVPISTPVHPALSKYTTLWTLSNLLIKPAMSEGLEIASEWAKAFYESGSATLFCKTFPRRDR